MSPALVQVETTLPARKSAARIAHAMVQARLAACAQVSGPIASTYRWQGKLETTREWLLVAKTTRARSRALIAAIEELHTYDTPQITVLPVTRATPRYADWLTASVTPARTGRGRR